MLRQYNPQRFRHATLRAGNRVKDVRVGTVPAGEILYIQDRPGRFHRPGRRNPWIVEAWFNRETGAACMIDRRYQSRMMSGGHLAQVRSLRDGRVKAVSDRHLLHAQEV